MNSFLVNHIKTLLAKYRATPKKYLGQNFLTKRGVVNAMINAAELEKEDTVLEIGPGTGVLTMALAEQVKKVIAVEKDWRMIEILSQTIKEFPNVQIIQTDILKLNTKYKIQNTKYKIVANIPYYLTARVIRKFLEEVQLQPKLMVLLTQKEVAQRICAKPTRMNILAVSVQFYAVPQIISCVKKTSFWPQPRVDSAILKIIPRAQMIMGFKQKSEREKFFRIVKAGFTHPRKQLPANLSKYLALKKEKVEHWLLENGINPTQRAQTLTLEEWIKLAASFQKV